VYNYVDGGNACDVIHYWSGLTAHSQQCSITAFSALQLTRRLQLTALSPALTQNTSNQHSSRYDLQWLTLQSAHSHSQRRPPSHCFIPVRYSPCLLTHSGDKCQSASDNRSATDAACYAVVPHSHNCLVKWSFSVIIGQESPAIADKPARRESLPKLLQFGVPTTLSLTILA